MKREEQRKYCAECGEPLAGKDGKMVGDKARDWMMSAHRQLDDVGEAKTYKKALADLRALQEGVKELKRRISKLERRRENPEQHHGHGDNPWEDLVRKLAEMAKRKEKP